MSDVWQNMIHVYQAMGLSDEESYKRILCKTTQVIEGTMNLNGCDNKREENEHK